MFERHGYHAAHVGGGSYNGVAVRRAAPDRRRPTLGRVRRRAPRSRATADHRASCRHPDARCASCQRVRPARPDRRPLALRVQAGLPRRTRRHGSRQWARRRDTLVVAGDINVAPTDSDVFHPDAFVGLDPRDRSPSATRSHACSRPGWSTSTSPAGATGAAVHVVEPRHRLLAQPGHAHRHDRHRHRARAGASTPRGSTTSSERAERRRTTPR